MDNSPIVNRINSLLAEKGISKKKFYEDCGITSASYSLWNTRKTKPRMSNLETIANYLDVPVSYLLEGVEQTEKVPTPVSKSGQHINIVKIAGRDGSYKEKRLTDEQVKALQTIIDQMPEAPEDL